MKFLALLLIVTQAWAGLPPSTLKDLSGNGGTVFNFKTPPGQATSLGGVNSLIETGSNNILQDPSFQATISISSVPGWTLGTGVNAGKSTSQVYQKDPQALALTFTALANGTDALSQDVTVLSGSVANENLENSFVIYNPSVSGLQVCPRIGGADQTALCANVPVGSSWVPVSASEVGGSTTTSVGVSLYNNSGGTISSGSVWIARAYVGQNRNIGTVAQAQELGSISITGCSAAWATTSTSSFASFGANSSCTYTPYGGASAPSTQLAAIKLSSVPAGNIVIQAEGSFQTSGSNVQSTYQITDGTTTAIEQSPIYGSASGLTGNGINQSFPNYAGGSNITFEIKGKVSTGTNYIVATGSQPLVIKVFWYPSQNQLAQTVATSPANWSGTSTLSGTTTSGSFADLGSVSGSVTTVGTPQNISCTATASQVGITCTGSGIVSGSNYHVCYGGYEQNSTANYTNTELTDGSNSVIAGNQSMASAANSFPAAIGQCANYTASSSTLTFKLRSNVTGGTGTVVASTWSVQSLSTPVNAVTLTGGVSTNYNGNMKMETASVVCGPSSSVTTESSTWISAVSNNASNTCNLTMTGFSATPTCTISMAPVASRVIGALINASSATTANFGCNFYNGTSLVGCGGPDTFNIICVGPR